MGIRAARPSLRTDPAPAAISVPEAVAKSKPDGHTIAISIGGPLAINTLLLANLRYDLMKEIAPNTQLVSQASVRALNNSLPGSSVSELLALIKADPGKYTFDSIGNGSLSHLCDGGHCESRVRSSQLSGR